MDVNIPRKDCGEARATYVRAGQTMSMMHCSLSIKPVFPSSRRNTPVTLPSLILVIPSSRLVNRFTSALYPPGFASFASLGVAVPVGRPGKGFLTEDGEGVIEAEALLEVEVGIKDKASGGESIGVVLFCKSAFCKSAIASVVSRPSAVTLMLTPDALMISERRVPASLLILKAQP